MMVLTHLLDLNFKLSFMFCDLQMYAVWLFSYDYIVMLRDALYIYYLRLVVCRIQEQIPVFFSRHSGFHR